MEKILVGVVVLVVFVVLMHKARPAAAGTVVSPLYPWEDVAEW